MFSGPGEKLSEERDGSRRILLFRLQGGSGSGAFITPIFTGSKCLNTSAQVWEFGLNPCLMFAASPHFFRQGGASPLPHFFGLKFVQKLVHCCNWLLTETQCKVISVQHVCRPKLFKKIFV